MKTDASIIYHCTEVFVGNEEKWKWAASKLTVSNNSVLDLLLSGKSEQIQSFFSLTDCVQHKRTFSW